MCIYEYVCIDVGNCFSTIVVKIPGTFANCYWFGYPDSDAEGVLLYQVSITAFDAIDVRLRPNSWKLGLYCIFIVINKKSFFPFISQKEICRFAFAKGRFTTVDFKMFNKFLKRMSTVGST